MFVLCMHSAYGPIQELCLCWSLSLELASTVSASGMTILLAHRPSSRSALYECLLHGSEKSRSQMMSRRCLDCMSKESEGGLTSAAFPFTTVVVVGSSSLVARELVVAT